MKHLTYEQRYTISVLLAQKKGVKEIAFILGKDRSVIYRELSRNSTASGCYQAAVAQGLCEQRQRNKSHFVRFTDSIREYVRQGLLNDLSPEQIVGRARVEGIACVSIQTIYEYVRQDKADPRVSGADKLYHHLRHIRNRHDRQSAQSRGTGVIPDRVMIDQRPHQIDSRSRLGDFEADTMWIARKACILTVVERKSGLVFIRAMPDRKSETLNQAMKEVLKRYPGPVRSITVDNGKEFFHHRRLAEMLNTKIYFAHPYRSGERGTNENTNGLLRQYLGRKTEISTLSEQIMEGIMEKLNQRPRKRLGFKTPKEYFYENF